MAEAFENGHAVVIGVDANNIPQLALPTVAKDVRAVYDVLIHPQRCAYKPDNVRLLMGQESTLKNILDSLYWLQDKVKEDTEATVIIYYSGHGMVDRATEQYYLIPYDIRALNRVRADAIKADSLAADISAIKVKRLLVILDCCHAAGMDVKDVNLSETAEAAEITAAPFPIDLPETKDIPDYTAEPGSKDISDLLEGEGRAILNSSTGSQSSYVRRDGKMSLFTYHLIEALTGHAPHPDDATVVYVTDVMSWVTHQVKKSAKSEGVEQTPVMRTSGVFPVARLIGGQGVAKGLGQSAPDPLEPLPPVGQTTTFHQQGQTVHGPQLNVGQDAHIGQIGNSISTGGGDYVGGDKIGGDKIGGDKVSGNKAGRDAISISGITGSTIAVGSGASASGGNQYGSAGGESLRPLFASLKALVDQSAPALAGKVSELESQVRLGARANDIQIANLVQDLVEAVPAASSAIRELFNDPSAAAAAGPTTQFALGRLR